MDVRIGILTAGGDAPGLNAAVRAIGRSALSDGHEVVGIEDGWAGLLGDLRVRTLDRPALAGILQEGGTLLGSVRRDLDHPAGGREQVLASINKEFDAVVAIGGDGTLSVAEWLAQRGAPIVGVPKTLDNDLAETEYCIGFDTAVSIVAEALDRLHTTAASHHRVLVLETMGRSTGWVAALGGLAGGADYIVIPEFPVTMDDVVEHITRRHASGSSFSIVVVAEGVSLTSLGGVEPLDLPTDAVGRVQWASRSVGHFLADQLQQRTGYETRSTVLGYLQRGGSPSAHDRIYATRLGVAAYEAVCAGAFGSVPIVRNGDVVRASLADVTASVRAVPRDLYELCARFF